MNNTMEVPLRRAALVLTALVVLQVLWTAARLLLLSEPTPIFPAESTLLSPDAGYGGESGGELSSALVSRPLFWKGRQVHVAKEVPVEDTESEPARREGSAFTDGVKLLGVYTVPGEHAGILIDYEGIRRRISLDESLDGWTFTMLSPESAVFESGDDSVVFELEHAVPAASSRRDRAGRKRAATAEDEEKREQASTNNDEKTGE